MVSRHISVCVIVGMLLGVLANLASWLLSAESSPFYEYFLYNVRLKNLWSLLNFPAFMILVLTGAWSEGASILVIFLQWFIIGFFGSFVIRTLALVRRPTNLA